MSLPIELPNLDATRDLARRLAGVLVGGDVLALSGDLGAGKTTLVREIARAFGVQEGLVSSPTFVLANEYPTDRLVPEGIVHIDAYRVGDEDELEASGWDRLTDPSRVVLIEWPSRIPHAIKELGGRVARLRLEHTGETSRAVDLVPADGWTSRPSWRALAGLSIEESGPTHCPVTGNVVPPDSPTWPFVDERARLADLEGWFSEGYVISREMTEADLEQGE